VCVSAALVSAAKVMRCIKCSVVSSLFVSFLLRSVNGVLSIRRISIRRIPIIGLGLGLGLGIGIGLGLGLGLGIAFGELKFGELKRNPVNC